MAKLKNEIVQEVLDIETGELIRTTTQKVYSSKINSESFFMTFIEAIAPIYKLKSATDLKLIIKFCEIAEFNTGKVIISSSLRKDICEQLGISNNQYSISLKSIKEKGIVTGDKGTFVLNPSIYWKGTVKSRESIMKDFTITISII